MMAQKKPNAAPKGNAAAGGGGARNASPANPRYHETPEHR